MARHFLLLFLFCSLILKAQQDSVSKNRKWQLNGTFFIGGNFFTKDIQRNYANQFAMGISFDIYYKKILLSVRDQIGFGKTNKEFIDEDIILPRKSKFRSYLLGADIGLVVINNERRKFIPFVGIYTFSAGQPLFKKTTTPHSSNFGSPFTLTYSFGFNYDMKLRHAEWKMIDGYLEKVSDYKFIRIKNAFYLPQFQTNRPGFAGEIYCITLEYGID